SPGAVQGRLRRYLLEGVPPTASVAAGEPQLPPLIRQLEQTNLEAFDAYRPEPYEGSATFFVGDRRTPGLCSPLPVWNQVGRVGRALPRPVAVLSGRRQAGGVVGPGLGHVGIGVGALARVVGVVAPGRPVWGGLAVEAAVVSPLAVAEAADPLRAEEQHAAG